MGEEGFSSDSSLLYHRGVPSALVDSQVWELADQTRTPTTRSSRGTSGCTRCSTATGGDAVDGPAAGARQQRRPDLVRRDRHRPVAVLPQRHRRRVRVRRDRRRHRRDGVRGGGLPGRRLRADPARHHAPLGAERAEPALRDRGEQPHPPAEALPLALRAAARARAVLRARPARSGRGRVGRGRGRRGAGQAPPRPASSAPG